MQKQLTQFKSVINSVESYFHFDSNCSTEIAKLALLECLKWIGNVEDQQKAALEVIKAQQEAAVTPEIPPSEKIEALTQPEATNDQPSA